MKKDITHLFCCIDDFCHFLNVEFAQISLETETRKPRRPTRVPGLTLSEMMTVSILFHLSPCKNFKYFYLSYLQLYKQEFPKIPSYERFVCLMPRLVFPMTLLLHTSRGTPTGIAFIDSTSLAVCHNKRMTRHKVFRGLATRCHTSIRWFYGLKLHVIINQRGELFKVKLTSGHVDDQSVVPGMTQDLWGLLMGDRGYISQSLLHVLYERGLKLVTGLRKNMKNHLMMIKEKILLRKRFISETVFDYLKNKFQIQHTRHRSPTNAVLHIISTLVAYQQKNIKPSINSF